MAFAVVRDLTSGGRDSGSPYLVYCTCGAVSTRKQPSDGLLTNTASRIARMGVTAMRACSACEYEVLPEDNFCTNCGTRYDPVRAENLVRGCDQQSCPP